MLTRKLKLPPDSELFEGIFHIVATEEEEETFETYLQTTEEWKQMLAAWEEEKKKNPKAKPPKPTDINQENMKEAFAFAVPAFASLIGSDLIRPDRVTVRMICEGKPLHSNGIYDEEENELSWTGEIHSDQNTPVYAYGYWIHPNLSFQEKLFGRVLLKEGDLAKYTIWYEGLDEVERAEWDAFLFGLDSTRDLKKEIGSFLFSREKPEGEVRSKDLKASLAQTARKLLVNALEKKE
jgi:hypothetical protein